MKTKDMSQLTFDFVLAMDRELAEQRERERIDMQQRTADAWLNWTVERYPPDSEEWDVILMGIRLCRHIHPNECASCKLGCYSHCPESLNMVKVCLKDYFRWCRQNNLKYLIRKQI